MDGGEVATATIDRNANIVAWSLQDYGGKVRSLSFVKNSMHLIIERDGITYLEVIDSAARLDSSARLSSGVPQITWSGLDDRIGETVTLIGDGLELGTVRRLKRNDHPGNGGFQPRDRARFRPHRRATSRISGGQIKPARYTLPTSKKRFSRF